MKQFHFLAFAVLAVSFASQRASAADGLALAKSNQCTACHAVDSKTVGPAFKAIAAKYKGDSAAASKLAASVKGGSSGKWGAIPMPPNGAISDADAKAIVEWILKQ